MSSVGEGLDGGVFEQAIVLLEGGGVGGQAGLDQGQQRLQHALLIPQTERRADRKG